MTLKTENPLYAWPPDRCEIIASRKTAPFGFAVLVHVYKSEGSFFLFASKPLVNSSLSSCDLFLFLLRWDTKMNRSISHTTEFFAPIPTKHANLTHKFNTLYYINIMILMWSRNLIYLLVYFIMSVPYVK